MGLDLRPRVGEMAVPTRIVPGSADVIPLEEAEFMAAHIPISTLVMMEGAGHLLGMIRSAEVGQAMTAFFDL